MAFIMLRQKKIWEELERELPPGLEEVRDFLCALSEFDQELVRELRLKWSGQTSSTRLPRVP